MPLSEWMRSIRNPRDSPEADYSAPGCNTSRRIAYHPPIGVSRFLLALLVSCFKRTIWICDQLWPYVGMRSLGMRLHRDCNVMAEVAKISPRVPSTSAQSANLSLLIISIIPSRHSYVAMDNRLRVPSISSLTTSKYLWNYRRTADDVSQAEYLQSNSCQCCSPLYKFRGGIQVTPVFRDSGERQGHQYSTKARSWLWSMILNSHCSCHGRRPVCRP